MTPGNAGHVRFLSGWCCNARRLYAAREAGQGASGRRRGGERQPRTDALPVMLRCLSAAWRERRRTLANRGLLVFLFCEAKHLQRLSTCLLWRHCSSLALARARTHSTQRAPAGTQTEQAERLRLSLLGFLREVLQSPHLGALPADSTQVHHVRGLPTLRFRFYACVISQVSSICARCNPPGRTSPLGQTRPPAACAWRRRCRAAWIDAARCLRRSWTL